LRQERSIATQSTSPEYMASDSKPKNIREIVGDYLLREAFQTFCVDELAAENFSFWEEVESFKRLEDESIRKERFEEIYEKYFSQDSDSEMNVSAEDRIRVDKAKSSGVIPKDVFDRIQRRVYAELSTELFYRFLRSEHFARYLEDKEDPDGSIRRREKLEEFFGMEIKGPLHRQELLVYVKRRGYFWYQKGRSDNMPSLISQRSMVRVDDWAG